jgi:cytochrome P450
MEETMPDTASAVEARTIADPWTLPLDELDVANADLFEHNLHGEYFRRLRKEDPVHYHKDSEFGPYWSITKFDDIVAVDSNHEVFSSNRDIVIGDAPPDFNTPMFIAMDGGKHRAQRKTVSPAVAPRQLSEVEDLIRQRVGKLLDSLPIGETFNWVDKVSIELTTQMLATLFDFPFEDRHLLPFWSDVTTNSTTVGMDVDMDERERQLGECLGYFTELWHQRAAAEPKFDFISLLAHGDETRDMVNNPMELLGNLMLLIVGGNDTTRNSMSGGVVAFNQFPEQWDKLRADHSLIPGAVSEIIRFQTPLGHMRRNALEDIEIGGKLIRKGDKVVMWYVSGNRDETAIEDPDTFKIDRERARQHLSFGFGVHRCMGNRVAEMQIRILWEEILARFSRIEMVGEPRRTGSNFVMGFKDVPVRLHAL